MKKLALGALCVGLMACGGDDSNVVIVDGGGGGDGMVVGACNPLTQTGCNAGEKCTWINDQDNPPVGHVGCAPDGTVQIGAACQDGPAGPMGYDNCAKGGVCLSGVCKTICDNQGGQPMCPANYSCQIYADFFDVGGNPVAGVCDPACDPLTQDLATDGSAACGSADPTMPNLGCYGYTDFSCAPTGMTSWDLTDRQYPRSNSAGQAYLNGCAPGFMPFFYESSTSMKVVCSGLCAAVETNSGAPGGVDGNAAAIGKLPKTLKAAGDATCGSTKKGSSAASECKFLWYFLEEPGEPGWEAFKASQYLDTLGVCVTVTSYTYDDDEMAGTPEIPWPSCTTLPAPTTTTQSDMLANDAGDWFCSKLSTLEALAPFTSATKPRASSPARQDMRAPSQDRMQIIRHTFH